MKNATKKRRARNTDAAKFPEGQFVKCAAIRFNSNGTVDVALKDEDIPASVSNPRRRSKVRK